MPSARCRSSPLSLAGSFAISGLLGWPATISLDAAVVGVACCVAVGVVAGYPAWRASQLDPVVALRKE